jgi:hypothetical protein
MNKTIKPIFDIPRKKKIIYVSIFLVLLFGYFLILKYFDNNFINKNVVVREPVVAGQFYPAEKVNLTNNLNMFYNNLAKVDIGDIKAIIVPHAGYAFSGQVASTAFKQLDNKYNKVFLIAANHNNKVNFNGISINDVDYYKTPLGNVKVSSIAKKLLKKDLFSYVKGAHTMHMIEVELPFLQLIFSEFEIIPMITGKMSYEDIKKTVDYMIDYYDENTLFVFSIDFSHYYPYDQAMSLDSYCINSLMYLDKQKIKSCTTDGNNVLLIVQELSKRLSLKPQLLDYKNSGDITGDKSRVVGYVSMVFYKNIPLNKEEQKLLMSIARKTMEKYVNDKEVYKPDKKEIEKYPRLKNLKAAFVSLDKNNKLRGSIGHLTPIEPLYLSVRDNAINAVSKDKRFKPVTPEELKDITTTISVLSIPQIINVNNYSDYLNKIKPFHDGLIIVTKTGQSTYLPTVWDLIPNTIDFLSNLCRKQGADFNCWQDPSTRIYKYDAQIIKERDIMG